VFNHIAEEYDFAMDTMEVEEDHVYIFLEAPPRYSPADVVQIMKSIFVREIFKKYPKSGNNFGWESCGIMAILSEVLEIMLLLT